MEIIHLITSIYASIAHIDDIDEEYLVIYLNIIYRKQHSTSAVGVELFSVLMATPLFSLRSSTTVSYGSYFVLNLYYYYYHYNG